MSVATTQDPVIVALHKSFDSTIHMVIASAVLAWLGLKAIALAWLLLALA